MKYKQLIINLIILIFTAIGLMLQSQNIALTVTRFNNQVKSIDVNTLKKITFSGTNLLLKYNNGGTELLAAYDISNMTFSNLTGLDNNKVSDISIFPNPSSDIIFVKNYFLPLIKVSIYSIQGKYIKDLKLVSNYLDITDLSNGVYILKMDNKTFKFTKK